MRGVLGFALVLSTFWLANSNSFKTLLLLFGVFSILAVIAIIYRMKRSDGESFPLILPSLRLPGYLLWMSVQILRSNIDVARRVWRGRAAISPVVITLPASQRSAVGRVLYANSITMTPGTVTLNVQDDRLEVHALTETAAEELEQGEMDRRVSALGA